MSSKRSRVGRSSSLGEIGLFVQAQPIESPAAFREKKRPATVIVAKPVQKPVKNSTPFFTKPVKNSTPFFTKPEQPRTSSILTLGSPVRETDDELVADERYGVFLEACFYCKKRITEKDDVFMYSYLRAFCSCECREKQIGLDEKGKKPSWESSERAVAECFLKKDLPRQVFSAQARKLQVAKFK